MISEETAEFGDNLESELVKINEVLLINKIYRPMFYKPD